MESISLGAASDLDRRDWYDCRLSFDDYRRGVEILGTSQIGKTNAIKHQLGQFVDLGLPFTQFDVEGSTTDFLLQKIASRYSLEEAAEKFVIVDFTNGRYHLPLNFLAPDPDFHLFTVVKQLVGVMAGVWASSFEVGVRMRGEIETGGSLLASHGLSLAEFDRLVTDKDFSAVLAERSTSELGRHFHTHYRTLTEFTFRSWIEAASNKVTPLALSPFLGPCFAAPTCVDFAAHMDASRSVLIRLDEAHLGEDLRLIGALLVAKYDLDSRRRAEQAPPHVLVLDEAQEYAGVSLARILARRQKRGLGVVISHQLAEGQFEETLFSTILGLARTRLCFPLGNMDHARMMVRQLFPLTGDRRTKPQGLDYGYWNMSEEEEHFARELQQGALGSAVIQWVHEGRTAWLETPKCEEGRIVPKAEIAEYVEASMQRHLLSTDAIERERQRRREYVAAMLEEARKRVQARKLRETQRRRRAA